MDMDFRTERVNKMCEELAGCITVQSSPITGWKVKKGTFFTPQQADESDIAWSDFDCDKDFWPGPDEHYWFRSEITVPESFNNKPLWISVATQVNFWDAVNPQFLLFVNGKVTQGVDVNHRECKICDCAKTGDKFTIDLQGYTGSDNDQHKGTTANLKLFASMMEISDAVNEAYYNLWVPNEIVKYLDDNLTSKINLQNALEQAINILDLRVVHSPEFYKSIDEFNKFIRKAVYEDLAGNDDIIATCIGATHIDVAWWWTVSQTREKAVRSFSTVLKLMDEYPEYKFMCSQPQLYQFVKERYPETFKRIQERVTEGRWEVEGGMWVEADCNVTSGESMIRQFMHGKKFFKDEFNKDNRILWLPDVFGYSAAMPQILKKCGIDYFMTTKISWNQYNKLPVDTFMWKGIDGTEVFTHLITAQEPNQPENSIGTGYGVSMHPVCAARAWKRYQQKHLNNEVLIAYGHSDGGGGPTRKMVETTTRMQCGLPSTPKVRMETVGTFFDSIYERVKDNPKLPKWVGELYLEYHRGTYTSMARNKRSNRKCELLWQDVEFFSSWADKLGLDYPKDEIYACWENILLNQFHDILPGSSIHEVYEVTKKEYAHLESRAKELIQLAADCIAENTGANENDIVVFNSLSFNRNDVVKVDNSVYAYVKAFKDSDGKIYPVQKSADGSCIFYALNIPSKGYKVFTPVYDDTKAETPFSISEDTIETPFYTIKLDRAYQFTSVYDKQADREVLKPGTLANEMIVYEDKPIYYDNWDIDIYYKEKSWKLDNVAKAEWIENGPVRATLYLERKFLETTVKQKVYFYADNRRIDFDTYVDWKQVNLLLKVNFPIDVNSNEASFDIQFGNVTRPTHKNTSWDKARFEVCGHKWCDISDAGYGLAVLNDCKYGHSVDSGLITLTLIKSGNCPNPVTDQEEHFFTYSMLPHIGPWRSSDIVEQAYMLNVPVYVSYPKNNEQKTTDSFLSINADNVIVETVKRAEDNSGTIIRMYEYKNTRSNVCLTWNKDIKDAVECDMLENTISPVSVNSNTINFSIKPYEVKTFKISD